MVKTYVIMGHSFLGEPGHLAVIPPHMSLGMPAKCGESFTRNGVMQYALFYKGDRKRLLSEPLGNVVKPRLGASLPRFEKKFNFENMGIEWFSRNHGYFLFPSQMIHLGKDKELTQGVFRVPNTNFNIGKFKNENSIIKGNPSLNLENILKKIQMNEPRGEQKIVYGLFCRTPKKLNLPNQKVTKKSRTTNSGPGLGLVEVKTSHGKRYLTMPGMKTVLSLRKTKNPRRSATQTTIRNELEKIAKYPKGFTARRGVAKPTFRASLK